MAEWVVRVDAFHELFGFVGVGDLIDEADPAGEDATGAVGPGVFEAREDCVFEVFDACRF